MSWCVRVLSRYRDCELLGIYLSALHTITIGKRARTAVAQRTTRHRALSLVLHHRCIQCLFLYGAILRTLKTAPYCRETSEARIYGQTEFSAGPGVGRYKVTSITLSIVPNLRFSSRGRRKTPPIYFFGYTPGHQPAHNASMLAKRQQGTQERQQQANMPALRRLTARDATA